MIQTQRMQKSPNQRQMGNKKKGKKGGKKSKKRKSKSHPRNDRRQVTKQTRTRLHRPKTRNLNPKNWSSTMTMTTLMKTHRRLSR